MVLCVAMWLLLCFIGCYDVVNVFFCVCVCVCVYGGAVLN